MELLYTISGLCFKSARFVEACEQFELGLYLLNGEWFTILCIRYDSVNQSFLCISLHLFV